ncbi:MFS transporter [Microbispora bryophytorum]|uniref:Putative MFS-type transporter YdeG n=1 Tax=Microbispora bryophytorum TaxID=1460882 RepID=A0A8H9H471_9ACTN|nr:MFS transporter [Microbispora bryophytorum]MBD3139771.1 MFS transporter [Microbispora bryophytorum]TQS02677.1 MFS transporter [Microbispora bryophytorum]GGO27402.1 putative MFS-type transporter YdeG [Microbispora bryophytorum]
MLSERSAKRGGIVGALVVSNLLGGVAVASGIAVGGLLLERFGGTSLAGLGQAASVLGAAVAAVPLAGVAARHGRRRSLALGYAIAVLGGALIVGAAVVAQLVVLLAGLALFGVGQAVNLQSRYAAADGAAPGARARAMSIVIWATTIGSVAGPNLSEVADRFGRWLGLPGLTGPYVLSVVSFALAGVVVAVFLRPGARSSAPVANQADTGEADKTTRTVGAVAALRWAAADPAARFAVVLVAVAHAMMVMVMVMTPLHMQHHGMSLQLVGVVISVHVLGMYALSPVFGWLTDRLGAVRMACAGMLMLATAVALGFVAASAAEGSALTALALTVLGLGWSASVISASALLAGTAADHVRVPLQGATDAGMNYAGAAAAALAGPILAAGGFHAVNVAAAVILVPAVAAATAAVRRNPGIPAHAGDYSAG